MAWMSPARSPRSSRRDAGERPEDTLLRLAVLLEAGVSPPRAWAHLAESGDPGAVAIEAEVASGRTLVEAIAARGAMWREVGVAWSVATTVGSPLAETLRRFAHALADGRETADQVRIALAEPAATARLMAWLPLIAIGLGLALGFDTLTVLVRNPLGIGCLVLGILLIFVAQRWNRALVRRAGRTPQSAGLDAELLAIALTGGVSIERARAVVDTARTCGPVGSESEEMPRADAEVERVLALSRSAGVPAAELLRAAAALERVRVRVEGRLRAAALSSQLLIPLGVCTLPAFLLLGVAPMVLGVVSTMTFSL